MTAVRRVGLKRYTREDTYLLQHPELVTAAVKLGHYRREDRSDAQIVDLAWSLAFELLRAADERKLG